MKVPITLTVNGDRHELHVDPVRTLLDVLREDLGLTGTNRGCNQGDCGACTVHLDGEAVNACLVLAVDADGSSVTTIEGLSHGRGLHALQQAFVDEGAVQCGYCTPGMIMTAAALLDRSPDPGVEEIRAGIEGNLCRCTGYESIVRAVSAAARRTRPRKRSSRRKR
jgi:carbon-monoxide dehydrogenase small subunit